MTESNAVLHVNVLAHREGERCCRNGEHSVIAYTPGTGTSQSGSLPIPARLESYKWERRVAPIFEMNQRMEQAMDEMQLYLAEHGHFEAIGTPMLDEWKTGMRRSLTA